MVGEDGGEAVKVLTVGPPCGRIRDLFAKVTAINAKYGPFEILLVLGDLFKPYTDGDDLSEDEKGMLDGSLQSPVPLYFALPPSTMHPAVVATIDATGHVNQERHEEKDQQPIMITESLFFLGKQSVSLVKGLRIAAMGGSWDNQSFSRRADTEETALQPLMNPSVDPASIDSLMRHPAFKETSSHKPANELDDAEPTSLAAARVQMAKRTEALQRQAELAAKPNIDVLLTNAWPTGITMFSDAGKLPHPTSRVWGSPAIARLARNAQARYHFALAPGSTGVADSEGQSLGVVGLDGTEAASELRKTGVFWEREPFRIEDRSEAAVSRFVSLARFANEKKTRWFMALNLSPAKTGQSSSSILPPNATPSPFAKSSGSSTEDGSKRKGAPSDAGEMDSGTNYRWADGGKRARHQQRNGTAGLPQKPDAAMPDRPRRPVYAVAPADCWFCLSNSQCAKHLIVTIGTECYIAMPKGQLPSTSDNSSPVPGGGHVLIIPVEHVASLRGDEDAEGKAQIAGEMEKWRSVLRKAYASFDAVMVAWEICRTSNTRAGHMQCQALPVPRSSYTGLQQYVRDMAKGNEYVFIEDQQQVRRFFAQDDEASKSDYFRFDFDDTTWLMLLDSGRRFNLQFPRQTLAAYMGVPDRADWKKCARSDAIETAETKAFKAAFAEFASEVE